MCTVNILEDAQQENTGLRLPLCVNEHNILPGIASTTSQKLSYLIWQENKDASPEHIKPRRKPRTAPVLFVFFVLQTALSPFLIPSKLSLIALKQKDLTPYSTETCNRSRRLCARFQRFPCPAVFSFYLI